MIFFTKTGKKDRAVESLLFVPSKERKKYPLSFTLKLTPSSTAENVTEVMKRPKEKEKKEGIGNQTCSSRG